MLKSYEIKDAEFGIIPIRESTRAHRVFFKAQRGCLIIVVPKGFQVSYSDLCNSITRNRDAIRRMLARTQRYAVEKALYDGRVIAFPEGNITIKAADNVMQHCVRVYFAGDNRLVVEYNPKDDISSPELNKKLVQCIMRLMSRRFGDMLRALVDEQARQLNLQVTEVRVGRGSRILGHCSKDGVITISIFAVFLPVHLRLYLVCHELAHLTYFEHSKAFHDLCDMYCGGRGYEWRAELKKYVLPIS